MIGDQQQGLARMGVHEGGNRHRIREAALQLASIARAADFPMNHEIGDKDVQLVHERGEGAQQHRQNILQAYCT